MSPCQRGPSPRQGAALTGTAKIVIHAVHANRATVIFDIFFIRASLLICFLLLVHTNRTEQDPRHVFMLQIDNENVPFIQDTAVSNIQNWCG
jgi:hypothetical protein